MNQKIKHFESPPGGIQPHAPGWLPCKLLFLAANLFLWDASFIGCFCSPCSHPEPVEGPFFSFILMDDS